jgi:hypothetical protein
MPAGVSVTTDPLIVYGMVGLLLGALVLALIFSRPRRGLGAIKRSDVPGAAPTDEPWMPTGDLFGHDPQPSAPPPPGATISAEPPGASPPGAPPTVHDPWSTGASGPTDAPQPPWGQR